MNEFINHFGGYISQYGYFALYGLFFFGLIGLPVPEETLLVFSGFLVSKGDLHFLPTFLVCYLGSISAMTAAYWIGFKLGHPFIEKYLKRFEKGYRMYKKTEEWFQRFGKWAIPIGYFLPGIRQYTAYFAGITELRFRTFAILAYAGGAFWTALFVSLGFTLGESWERVFQVAIKKVTIWILLIFIAVVLVAYVYQRVRKKRAGGKPNE